MKVNYRPKELESIRQLGIKNGASNDDLNILLHTNNEIGKVTPFKDSDNNDIFIGDILEVYYNYKSDTYNFICNTCAVYDCYGCEYIIFGLGNMTDEPARGFYVKNLLIKKIKSYKEIQAGDCLYEDQIYVED